MRRFRTHLRNEKVSSARDHKLSSLITKTFSEGTVSRRVKLARFFENMTKWSSAFKIRCSFRMAGSARMALPISESSIKRTFFRGTTVWRIGIILLNQVPSQQSGTPTKKSIDLMVSTFIHDTPRFETTPILDNLFQRCQNPRFASGYYRLL